MPNDGWGWTAHADAPRKRGEGTDAMSAYETIPPDRLMDAVDAIFEALTELGEASFKVHPAQLMGHEGQPEVFVHFTRKEIEEAARFLDRLGVLPL